MTKNLQPLRGTKDLFGNDYKTHEYIINTAKKLAELYGYLGIATPIIEYAKVFDRTLGETSDVVSKELYSFHVKGSNNEAAELIALRPEFTAGIARAFISNSLSHNIPSRFFSYGPLFRYDRPQAGRQRQFHQINFEYIGAGDPCHDAEIISLAQDIVDRLEIAKDVTLELNSLGCKESRALYSKKLFEYFEGHKNNLSEDSISRLSKNPLRILDSKNEQDKKIAKNAPLISESYSDLAKKYFDEVLKYLDLLGIKYQINPKLVRGLDYYCHTSFEYTTTKLGAQSSIIGGGRYDGLIELLGGPSTPAIGFAAGLERLALMREFKIEIKPPLIIIPLNQEDIAECMKLSHNLRKNNIASIIMDKGKVDKRLGKALNQGANYVIFIGKEERDQNKYKLKDLRSRTEETLVIEEIIGRLA